MKGSRTMAVSENNLQTLEKYNLFADLLDSNGIVDESVLQKLRLNTVALLENHNDDLALLSLCRDVLFHDNMKAFGLHQLILLYLAQNKKIDEQQ